MRLVYHLLRWFLFHTSLLRKLAMLPESHRKPTRSLPTGPYLVPSHQRRLRCEVRHHEHPTDLLLSDRINRQWRGRHHNRTLRPLHLPLRHPFQYWRRSPQHLHRRHHTPQMDRIPSDVRDGLRLRDAAAFDGGADCSPCRRRPHRHCAPDVRSAFWRRSVRVCRAERLYQSADQIWAACRTSTRRLC
jgi:hypothetical protein